MIRRLNIWTVLSLLACGLGGATVVADPGDFRIELERQYEVAGEAAFIPVGDPSIPPKGVRIGGDAGFDPFDAAKRAGMIDDAGDSGTPRGVPPANDDCANAILVSEGSHPFSTAGATTDGPLETICDFGFVDGGAVNSDIWYRYVAPFNGLVNVSLCGSGYDTKLAIYLRGCPTQAHEAIACDEDECNPGLQSVLNFGAAGGETYYIRIGGFNGAQGSGTMTIGINPAPANDSCETAMLIECDSITNIDNSYATESPEDPAFSCYTGGGNQGKGTLWFKFVAVHASMQVTTCLSTGTSDTLMAVYSGTCPFLTRNEIGCGEDECGSGSGRLSTMCLGGLQLGQTYYIQLATFSDATRGAMTLELTCPCPIGPDVTVGAMFGSGTIQNNSQWNAVRNWGRNASLGITGYSVGTISCNPGDVEVSWNANNNKHPVIGQQLYRLKNNRFEQIGMSWVKHGFLALAEDQCVLGCITPSPFTGLTLGVGCSDPYNADLNGTTTRLGPRGHINAYTGLFPFPTSSVPFPPPGPQATIGRRLQVYDADLIPAQNTGARYFIEGHYATSDDATLGNGLNNATYREVLVTNPAGSVYVLTMTGSDFRLKPAIAAWKVIDPSVVETTIDVPSEGRFIVSAKASDLGGGMWHYEYAVHNFNSDKSAGAFTIPFPAGVNITNVGFHDVDYHSGDSLGTVAGAIENTDWTHTIGASSITWQTESFSTKQYANALRWATLYNFRFDADTPPTNGDASIALFKPFTPQSVSGATLVPSAPIPVCNCFGDINGDTLVDGADIDPFVQMYLQTVAVGDCAEVDGPPGQPLDDNDVAQFVTLLLDGNCAP